MIENDRKLKKHGEKVREKLEKRGISFKCFNNYLLLLNIKSLQFDQWKNYGDTAQSKQ